MRYKIHLTKHAQEDLEHIFDYIANDSPQNASQFILEIEKRVYSLENPPNRNPLIPENEYFGTAYRHLIYHKYRIIYRITEDNVFILRVIHGAKLLEI